MLQYFKWQTRTTWSVHKYQVYRVLCFFQCPIIVLHRHTGATVLSVTLLQTLPSKLTKPVFLSTDYKSYISISKVHKVPQKLLSSLTIVGLRMMTWSKFLTEDPHTLGATITANFISKRRTQSIRTNRKFCWNTGVPTVLVHQHRSLRFRPILNTSYNRKVCSLLSLKVKASDLIIIGEKNDGPNRKDTINRYKGQTPWLNLLLTRTQ